MTKTKKCENCGTLNELGSAYCEKCGNSLYGIKKNENKPDTVNQVNCPYCGLKIPTNVSKCGHCGEWIDRSKSNTPIIIGYIVTFLGIAINMFAYVPHPGGYMIVCILTLLPPLVVTSYLLTRKDSKNKKHGIVLLVILIIFSILCYLVYLGTVQEYEMNQMLDRIYSNRYSY